MDFHKLSNTQSGEIFDGRLGAFDGSKNIVIESDNVTVKNATVTGYISVVADNVILDNCHADSISVRSNSVIVRNSQAQTVELDVCANSLLSENRAKQINVKNCFNCAIILNNTDNLVCQNNVNVYVIDNKATETLCIGNNDHVIADGNECGKLCSSDNKNVNGNTLTDVDVRSEFGANDDLLPHTNKDLFVGMPRQSNVLGTELSIGEYIKESAKTTDVIIVPPGAYTATESLLLGEELCGKKLYAYGVYYEFAHSSVYQTFPSFLLMENVKDLQIFGLTLGCVRPSSGQVRVVDKKIVNDEYTLTVIADAGFMDGLTLTDTGLYHTFWPEMFYVDGDGKYKNYPEDNLLWSHEIKKNTDENGNYDGTMTFKITDRYHNLNPNHKAKEAWEKVTLGTVITCRLASGSPAICAKLCDGIYMRDCVLYGYSAHFSNYSYNCDNIRYERYHNTTHSATLIDEETYEKYKAIEEKWGVSFEIRRDELGRCRGAYSRSGSVDGFHVTKCKKGVSLTSCLLEGMVDDGSNQHAASSRLHGYEYNADGKTVTLYFKGTTTSVFWGSASSSGKLDDVDFSECQVNQGDVVYVYAPSGATVCETPALASQVVSGQIQFHLEHKGVTKEKMINVYAVVIDKEAFNEDALIIPGTDKKYDLSDNHFVPDNRVVLDNLSQNSSGYTMDNVKVYNGHSRGFLLKSTDNVIKHCTFKNICYNALLIRPETEWAESTFARRTLVKQCLFDNVGHMYHNVNVRDQACIRIQSTSSVVSEATLPIDDITVTDCKFTNNSQRLAIHLNSARNIHITNNVFDENDKTTSPEIDGTAVLLDTCMNVEISGNTYNYAHYKSDVKNVVKGANYANVYGKDVTDASGAPILPDLIVK